ncbi:hypothetical protein J7E79_02690 [Bacillus sp. ISL-40]|uniref:phage tail assembly chaperone G n=1 Tax=unclassified Bacillus (in: firmicutes) TaxID=185979 RepID=UPI001BE98560|nr:MULTISPECIES: hypothetical protein [unclassified Bacillus (in: firmicutes)]MBT2696343.1 hypothetical protein [Bacillus sp. ISL-40]MBT2743192.1 hypothetical protein [Bacillus sp. ISL-77]
MRKLTLLIDGEEKTFTIPFVTGMVWRKWIELRAKVDTNNLNPQEVDQLAELVIYAFGNRFTLEEYYAGLPHDKVMLTFDNLFSPSDQEDSTEGNGKK